jgi:hypothetical protein
MIKACAMFMNRNALEMTKAIEIPKASIKRKQANGTESRLKKDHLLKKADQSRAECIKITA